MVGIEHQEHLSAAILGTGWTFTHRPARPFDKLSDASESDTNIGQGERGTPTSGKRAYVILVDTQV